MKGEVGYLSKSTIQSKDLLLAAESVAFSRWFGGVFNTKYVVHDLAQRNSYQTRHRTIGRTPLTQQQAAALLLKLLLLASVTL